MGSCEMLLLFSFAYFFLSRAHQTSSFRHIYTVVVGYFSERQVFSGYTKVFGWPV